MMRGVVLLSTILAACGDDPPGQGRQPLPVPPLSTPAWAFEPWISKDISDGPDTYAFVQGFEDRDIPVGALVLDSPWETQYNTFVPNDERYPDFAQMVADMHTRGVRVVLWVTQMVNEESWDLEPGGDTYRGPSPNFAEGLENGYFVNGGETSFWWKGRGAGVDFFNPDAVDWWRSQQDTVLDMGVNGWKLDFGESYILTDTVTTHEGVKSHQEYSEAYYRDFLVYGAHKRGLDELVIMARPWDESYGFDGRFFARPEHLQVGWVGDQRRDWFGLSDALDHMFRSAAAGYAMIGSDIGGYLDHDDQNLTVSIPWDTEVFARWTALGAMTPFMQLHGRSNITPWTVPDHTAEVVALYRYWATLHHELVPFLFSITEEAYAGGPMPMVPQGQPQDWPGDYRFVLGGAFLVAPLLDATGARDVALPAGDDWYDWWDAAADAYPGGQTLVAYDASDWQRVPLFVRRGAIVPASVDNDVTGLGNESSAGALTALVYPDEIESTFHLHESDGATTIRAQESGAGCAIELSRAPRGVILRVRTDVMPTAVGSLAEHATRAGWDAADSGWWPEPAARTTWVKLAVSAGPVSVDLTH